MPIRSALTLGAALPLLAGCAAAPHAAGAPSHAPAAGAPGAARAEGAASNERDEWSALTWEERHDQMTFLVHPNMARLFQRFEGKPYPDLTCRSCHGTDAEQVAYRMPHGLPPLDPAHLPSPEGTSPEARLAKFMIEQVTPEMADLLGVSLYDPRTGRGFGCFGCHPERK